MHFETGLLHNQSSATDNQMLARMSSYVNNMALRTMLAWAKLAEGVRDEPSDLYKSFGEYSKKEEVLM